jgi:uncharacterized repeat protein (TIGR03803 family)
MQVQEAEKSRGRSTAPWRLVPAILLAVVSALASNRAQAAGLETLYSFCAKSSCTDGAVPLAPVIMDASGRLYGTTIGGGDVQEGTAFELVRHQGTWKEVVLHSFCAKPDCADGAGPTSPLIMDVNGNLYGVTYITGIAKEVVFELVNEPDRRKLQFRRLYEFCSQENCPDGVRVQAGLSYAGQSSGQLYDGVSPLFGTTYSGGAFNQGTVYKLTPGARKWHQEVIYSFCGQGGDCVDGAAPAAPVSIDGSGNLFGTTSLGGAHGGVVFMLAPNARAGWSETVLYDFCSQPACADGAGPNGVILDATGKLYGTTSAGAGANCGGGGCGVAFELSPNGSRSQYTVLYTFCSQSDCRDGINPTGSLAMDATGNLFGVAVNGGNSGRMDGGGGTAFELSGSAFRVLYRFCSESHCADGANPFGITLTGDGRLVGTTGNGGSHAGGGTVFELRP